MRLQVGDRFPAELLAEMQAAWDRQSEWLPDRVREGENLLEYFLFQDSAQWYQIPNHQAWFYIWNMIPGLSADFYWISNDDIIARSDARDALKMAMREYDLRRLTLHLPAPVEAAQRAAQGFGFVQEGRMRDASMYWGQYADTVVMGFHRSEVEKGVPLSPAAAKLEGKPRRRRRRSRRKAKVA